MKVQSLREEQAAPNQPINRTVSNLSQTQQFNNKLWVPSAKRRMNISQCPKEKARLKREAKERGHPGDKLPGGTGAQNTSTRLQQVDTETEEESVPVFTGCVICFALGRDLHQ